MDYYAKIPDLMETGIIAIDYEGHIQIYNEVAKDFFGLHPCNAPGHPGGRLVNGDIVVIANNMLGADDGGLKPEDLKIIGVDPSGIEAGSAIVAIGKKGDAIGQGLCRCLPQGPHTSLTLETTLDGIFIQVRINFHDKVLSININNTSYNYPYFWGVGHMAALDGVSHHVKFYQHRGFTSRKEELKLILQGSPYVGKGEHARVLDTLYQHIQKLHPDSEVISKLLKTAYGEEGNIKGMESFINGIPVRCSIKALDHGKERVGALLEILDITELKAVRVERERAIIHLKKLEEKITNEILQKQAFQDIIGQSPKMKRVIETALKVAETNSTVLLLGESGTGKNLFAEAIHKASPRRKGPFVYINCASIPENLLESELFGHKKGSFTGAIAEKRGKFEQANGGTVFLDEINELPQRLQAKLLHVLHNRTYNMVGGLEPISVDIRIIAASNKDLAQLVSQGFFRNDLYYRINVLSILLPSLREHKEDLIQLVSHLTECLEKKMGNKKKEISPDVIKILFNYNWPGNIRELENVLERAIIMSDTVINPEHLPHYILEESHQEIRGNNFINLKNIGPLKNIVEETEKKALERALELTGGNRKRAMGLLQMGKTNFYEKLKRFDIWE